MNNLGYISYGITIMVGSLLALNHVMGFTSVLLVTYIAYNRMFCNQVSQASNQFNLIILGLAGSERIFEVMDEAVESDEGYVTLVSEKRIVLVP
jgi:ATP-binding cassette subfamily B protein